MPTRVKLLLLIAIALMIAAPLAIAQEETPSIIEQFALTATAMMEARTTTPTPMMMEHMHEMTEEATVESTEEATVELTGEAAIESTEEATVELTEEATPEPTETPAPVAEAGDDTTVRGIPLLVMLFGAVMVLLIGTVVFLRENPRPLDEDDEEA